MPVNPRVSSDVARPPLPLWASRLGRPSLSRPPFPSSPEEGLQQALALSDLGWQWLIARLQAQHPDASPTELRELAGHEVERGRRSRDQLTFRPRP